MQMHLQMQSKWIHTRARLHIHIHIHSLKILTFGQTALARRVTFAPTFLGEG